MINAGEVVAALREWVERILGALRRRRSDPDLASELAFHIEQAELELRRQGYGAAEAYRLARVRTGNAERAMEALRAQSGIPWFGIFTLDVLLGGRMLRKYWGLSLIGGLALAVAIGICAAVFVFFDVIWNEELPLDEADRVVAIQLWDPSAARRRETPFPDFERWRDGLSTLRDVGAFRTVRRSLITDGGNDSSVQVAEMSAAGFRVARTAPLVGRTLADDDELPGAAPVAVIGEREWRQRFDGDPDVVGRTIRLDDVLHTIVGVMPEGFGFPINHRFWIPLRRDVEGVVLAPPGGSTFGRLAPDATLESANAELTAMGRSVVGEPGDAGEPLRLLVLPYAQNFVSDIDPDAHGRRASNARLIILLMSLLLVPPGVNIAILVYARTITRQQEIAVRTALGASRRRIIAQLFVEMLVLSAAAAAVALIGVRVIALYVESVLLRQLTTLPFWIDPRVSARTVLFVAVLAVAAAAVTGLLPALRVTRQYSRPGLNALAGRNRARLGAFWTALIVAQIAFSFAALPVATELAWGTLREHVLGPGFPAEQYLSAQLSLDDGAPAVDVTDPARQATQFSLGQQALFERLRSDPAVMAGPTLVSAVPGQAPWARVEIDGRAPSAGDAPPVTPRNPIARSMRVDADYFETFETRPLLGRTFLASEFSAASRSVVVSERFVDRSLDGASPLGLRLRYTSPDDLDGDASDEPWYEIVGVVPDVPAHAYRGTIYHPLVAASTISASVAVRLAPGTPAFLGRLSAMAARTSPPLQLSELRTLDQVYAGQALGNYIGAFALVAGTLSVVLLAAAGTYALMSFTVNERRREIGIRVALGAPRGRLLSGVLRRALRQVLLGAIVGVSIAVLIEQKIPVDSLGGIDVPGVLPAGVVFVMLIGLAATFGPARRALGIDPNAVLRDDG